MEFKYTVKLGWGKDNEYEFRTEQRGTALSFAEIAAGNRVERDRDVTIVVEKIGETDDDQSNDESEV